MFYFSYDFFVVFRMLSLESNIFINSNLIYNDIVFSLYFFFFLNGFFLLNFPRMTYVNKNIDKRNIYFKFKCPSKRRKGVRLNELSA